MRLFATKDARGIPRWKKIYDHLATLDHDALITFEDLGYILETDDRNLMRSTTHYARMILERDNSKTLASVRGVGYRIAKVSEHEGLARKHHTRARRQLRAARMRISSADRSKMEPEARKYMDDLEHHVRRHEDMIRRLDDRVTRNEQRTKDAEEAAKSARREGKESSATLDEQIRETNARVDSLAEMLRRFVKDHQPSE